MDKIDVKI